jgi:hypothetical protein
MGFLRAEVVARVAARDRFGALAAAWFEGTRARLCPDIDRGLAAGPSLVARDLRDPMGPAGGAAGELWTQPRPVPVGGRRVPYTDRVWRAMLDGLDTSYPFHAELAAVQLDERGRAGHPYHNIAIGVHRLHQHPEWVCFRASRGVGSSGEPEFGQPLPEADQREWAEHVKAWTAEAGGCYAQVTDDPSVLGGTALEDATRHDPEDIVPRCHEVLRGYTWVTVCAPELAARLGGVPALTASRAFHEVTELAGGQVFLRATPALPQYEGEALRRVFEVLAPVLLPGRPDPRSSATAYSRLLPDEDAADYR